MTIRPEDWEILGIEPGADIGQVRRAYRHRRSLYEPAALATYNLLDDEEREGMVDRIEEAYRRIIGSELPAAPQAPPPTINPDAANEVVIQATLRTRFQNPVRISGFIEPPRASPCIRSPSRPRSASPSSSRSRTRISKPCRRPRSYGVTSTSSLAS